MRRYLELAAPLLRRKAGEPLKSRKEYSELELLSALDQESVIAFLGSGISYPFEYPTWQNLAIEILDVTSRELEAANGTPAAALDYIRSLQGGARKNAAGLDANALMFLMGACRTALEQGNRLAAYDDYFSRRFAPTGVTPAIDPFEALLELPIRRFATTNYDCEVERALVRYRFAEPGSLGLKPGLDGAVWKEGVPRFSFTQAEQLEVLVRFSLDWMERDESMVFHCHGRFDTPNSVVATEADYQRWYLGMKDDASQAYRQSMEFLLGSNPMLFVGYGLKDEDLLRPLRQLGALDPGRKQTRPLFALLPCSTKNQELDQYQHEALFERFGLHVLSFECREGESQTASLCRELRRLGQRLPEARQEWSEKPKLRLTAALVRLPKPHCEINSVMPRVPERLPALETATRKPGVVVLVGPSGCGKTALVLELIREQSQEYDGTFYWNAHYANESITAIDAALSYLDPDGKYRGDRLKRLVGCLRGSRFLLVIDGCERLLSPSNTVGDGISYSTTFRRLLGMVNDPESQSTVIFVSRLRPVELFSAGRTKTHAPPVQLVTARRLDAHHLRRITPFSDLPEEGVSGLCSLLRGHGYGLKLAGEYLKRVPDIREVCKRLTGFLANELRDARLRAVIFLLIQQLDREGERGLVKAFLTRLGFFLSPVCSSTRDLCFELAWEEVRRGRSGPPRDMQNLYEELINTGLLIRMSQPGSAKGTTYTVHVTVRAALLQSSDAYYSDPLPAFGLSGYTSGRQGINPAPAQSCPINQIFERLLESASDGAACQDQSAQMLCRDAYCLIRTRMEANTAPRWCKYDEYLHYGLRVAILAKQTTPGNWAYCEHDDGARFAMDEEASLHPAELAWLYNDLGIALSAAGYVCHATAFWEQAYEITRLIEDPRIGGGYHTEILLSLAYSFIERGRLSAASHYLYDAERLIGEFEDSDGRARILGLRGLIAHLHGNFQSAEDLYLECLKGLDLGTNLRAKSIFSKHLADLMLARNQHAEAEQQIRLSRSLAESGIAPELVANARMSEGHRLFRTGELVKARIEYRSVLQEARERGCRKLEVRALTALARLALDQKDAEVARDHAVRALSLANQYGMALRKTHGLVVLGLATLEIGSTGLGIGYLQLAKRMADGQEYWARSREAENKLLELGVDPRAEAIRS